MYTNVINLVDWLAVKEEQDNYTNRVQLDEIMKKLFYIPNKRPIIDLLNTFYGDNISYDADIIYLNKEAINESIQRKSVLISQECDMLIRVDSDGRNYEYLLEFQTRNDRQIGIRLFRYSFELKVQALKSLSSPIVIELPNPYVILLEENKNVPESYDLILKAPGGDSLKYTGKVLKYWEQDLDSLYRNNMYLLFPLKVFEVRKKITRAKGMNEDNPKYSVLIKEIRDDILKITREILEYIEVIYIEKKIDYVEYNEFGVVIGNLTMYLSQEVDKLISVSEEVGEMFKTFIDPEVEKRGIEKGIEKGIQIGDQKATLRTKREDIFELLEDVGIISDDVKRLIEKENNVDILKSWLKIAARVGSIDEFRNRVGLH